MAEKLDADELWSTVVPGYADVNWPVRAAPHPAAAPARRLRPRRLSVATPLLWRPCRCCRRSLRNCAGAIGTSHGTVARHATNFALTANHTTMYFLNSRSHCVRGQPA